jgi:hypothetical protein
MINRRSLLVGMAGASFLAGSPKAKAAGMHSGRDETFGLFDSLLFTGKPDLSRYGFKHARTVYENELWPPKRSAIPNETAVRSKADAVLAEGAMAAVPVILDAKLAIEAGVGIVNVRQFEADAHDTRRATLEVIARAFNAARVELIDENGCGPGVRLRKRHQRKT